MFLITRRRRTDGRTDGEEEKSVSDGAAAAAEMYISDVQEDDLEIAIKVRSGMNKAVCPDRRPSRHVIFEAKSRTLRLLGRLDPFGNTLLPRGRAPRRGGCDPVCLTVLALLETP